MSGVCSDESHASADLAAGSELLQKVTDYSSDYTSPTVRDPQIIELSYK